MYIAMKNLSTKFLKQFLCYLLFAVFAAADICGPPPDPGRVDVELSLVVDVSSSIVSPDFDLMMQGYESAFRSDAVLDAITGGAFGAAAVNFIFFADSATEVIPFTRLDSAASAQSFADELATLVRPDGFYTRISSGIDLAAATLGLNGFDGSSSIILVAGDSDSTRPWPDPTPQEADSQAASNAIANGVDQINGVVIDDPYGFVAAYYDAYVTAGSGAFVRTALDFSDFISLIEEILLTQLLQNPMTDGAPILSAVRQSAVLAVRQLFGDMNGRIAGQKAGFLLMGRAPDREQAASGGRDLPRAGEAEEGPKWELYGSVDARQTEVDASAGLVGGSVPVALAGYELQTAGGSLGAERALSDKWSLGGSFSALEGDLELDGNLGEADYSWMGLAAYASYFGEDCFTLLQREVDLYAGLLVGYAWGDYDLERSAQDCSVHGATEAEAALVECSLGVSVANGRWRHGPLASFTYMDGELKGFSETGSGTNVYDDMPFDSAVSRLGYQAAYFWETGAGWLIPQLQASWAHEFANDAYELAGVFLAGAPDDDLAELSLGLHWQISQRLFVSAKCEMRLGSESESLHGSLRAGLSF